MTFQQWLDAAKEYCALCHCTSLTDMQFYSVESARWHYEHGYSYADYVRAEIADSRDIPA
jgi:hypothetical protein